MEVKKMVNCTEHDINLMLCEGNVVIHPCGKVARCVQKRERISTLLVRNVEIPVNKSSYGEVYDLPGQEEGTVYIVSNLVAQAVKGKRNDCLIPDDTVRDDRGRIIGCKALSAV